MIATQKWNFVQALYGWQDLAIQLKFLFGVSLWKRKRFFNLIIKWWEYFIGWFRGEWVELYISNICYYSVYIIAKQIQYVSSVLNLCSMIRFVPVSN